MDTRDPYPDQRPSIGVRWYRHLNRIVELSVVGFGLVAAAALAVLVATGTFTDFLTTDGDFDASAGRVLVACGAALLIVIPGGVAIARLRRWLEVERVARAVERERRQRSANG